MKVTLDDEGFLTVYSENYGEETAIDNWVTVMEHKFCNVTHGSHVQFEAKGEVAIRARIYWDNE